MDVCRCRRHDILDVSSYDSDTLSVLLVEATEDGLPVLAQIPLSALNVDNFVSVATQPLQLEDDV